MILPKGYDRDDANSKDYNHKNTSSDSKDSPSELEEKKWHIDRIERTLETIIKQLESERAQNKSEADVIENRITT